MGAATERIPRGIPAVPVRWLVARDESLSYLCPMALAPVCPLPDFLPLQLGRKAHHGSEHAAHRGIVKILGDKIEPGPYPLHLGEDVATVVLVTGESVEGMAQKDFGRSRGDEL
jgi:hypothetical protein